MSDKNPTYYERQKERWLDRWYIAIPALVLPALALILNICKQLPPINIKVDLGSKPEPSLIASAVAPRPLISAPAPTPQPIPAPAPRPPAPQRDYPPHGPNGGNAHGTQ